MAQQKLQEEEPVMTAKEREERERAKREAAIRIARLELQLRLLKQRGELWTGQNSS